MQFLKKLISIFLNIFGTDLKSLIKNQIIITMATFPSFSLFLVWLKLYEPYDECWCQNPSGIEDAGAGGEKGAPGDGTYKKSWPEGVLARTLRCLSQIFSLTV